MSQLTDGWNVSDFITQAFRSFPKPSPRYGQPALDALEESCFMAATWGRRWPRAFCGELMSCWGSISHSINVAAFFWRVFEPRAGTFEEVQQADVEKNAHNFIIGQIFSPWRLHLWDTHKATVAVTLPPQPSGGHTVLSGDISPAIVWAQHTSLFNSTFFLDHIPIYIGSRTHQMIRDLFMYRFSSPTHKAQFEQFQGTSGGNHGFLMVFTCFDPQV